MDVGGCEKNSRAVSLKERLREIDRRQTEKKLCCATERWGTGWVRYLYVSYKFSPIVITLDYVCFNEGIWKARLEVQYRKMSSAALKIWYMAVKHVCVVSCHPVFHSVDNHDITRVRGNFFTVLRYWPHCDLQEQVSKDSLIPGVFVPVLFLFSSSQNHIPLQK